MKLRFSSIFLLIVISTSIYAQKAGLKGGVNFSNLYISDVDDENMKLGFNVGVYYRADLNDFLAIQPELLVSQKGSEVQYSNFLGGSGKYRFNLNYIQIPVLGVLKVKNFNIHAGPYISLLASANVKVVDSDGSINSVSELDRDDFNSFDSGLSAGLGFDFNTGLLGVRYDYGFQEIGNSAAATDATTNSKNSALQFYVGFDF